MLIKMQVVKVVIYLITNPSKTGKGAKSVTY